MITHPPSLASAMTPFPYSIPLDAKLHDAEKLMAEHDIHHLPVTVNHDVVGIVTQRDIIAALARRKARGRSTALAVSDVYVPEVYVVDLNEPLRNVLQEMAERHIGSAVVTRQGKLAGVFTSVDVCRCFAEFLEEAFPEPDGGQAA